MYLMVAAIFLLAMLLRFGLRQAGYNLKPWLPPSGRKRYYADLGIAAMALLCVAILCGFDRSLRVAFVIVILASGIAIALETLRTRNGRGLSAITLDHASAATRPPDSTGTGPP